MSDMKCPFCGEKLEPYYAFGIDLYSCSNLTCKGTYMQAEDSVWQELIRTRKALDKGMKHIAGLNNMIESWYKLLQSDKDTSTKYAILKSAISAYVENKKGAKNE